MASKITTIVANFETQLASTIGAGGVTGSLKSPVVDDDGVTLPNAKYVMCVDLGNSKEEHLIFDLVGTTGAMTNIKSVSRQGVETVGAVRQHRTGAKVTLTNFANLLYISKLLQGQVALDGTSPLVYDVAPTFNNVLQLATKGYIDGIAIAGSPDATLTTKGITKLTTHNLLQGNFDFENAPRWPVNQTGTGYIDGSATGSKYNKQYGWSSYSTHASGYSKFDEIMASSDPTFDTPASWSYGNGGTVSGGKCTVTAGTYFLSQINKLTVGKTYYFKFKYTMTAGYRLRFTDRNGYNGTTNRNYWLSEVLGSSGECYGSFVAGDTSFGLEASDNAFTGTIDDFYVYEGVCLKMYNGATGNFNEAQSASSKDSSVEYVGYFSPTVKVKPSTTYNYSVKIKTNVISGAGNSGGASVAFIETTGLTGAGQQTNAGNVNTTTGWTTYTGSFTTTAITQYLHITISNYGHTGAGMLIESYFDDIVLTEANNVTVTTDNDLRLPTQDQKDALAGTVGVPNRFNKFLTEENIPKFPDSKAGDGSDGDLVITSGTTTIDCGGAKTLIRNYNSMSITGSGKLAFSNTHATGTVVILRSKGDVTLTSSSAPMLDLTSCGGKGGAAVTGDGNFSGNVGSDAVYATFLTTGAPAPSATAPAGGGNYSLRLLQSPTTVSPFIDNSTAVLGSGGASSGLSVTGTQTSAAGGDGGGTLYLFCGGAFNFTTANGISVAGKNGGNGTISGIGGGGGGGAGACFIYYKTLTANSGSINVAGGNGGTGVYYNNGGGGCGAGGAGAGGSALINGGGGAGGSGFSIVTKF